MRPAVPSRRPRPGRAAALVLGPVLGPVLVLGPALALGTAVLPACGAPPDRPAGAGCVVDADCGGEVCTRSGECAPAAEVRSVRVAWTVGGAPASAAACAGHPSLIVALDSPDPADQVGWAPVPCAPGLFTVDKIARRYARASIGLGSQLELTGAISAAGEARFDLP